MRSWPFAKKRRQQTSASHPDRVAATIPLNSKAAVQPSLQPEPPGRALANEKASHPSPSSAQSPSVEMEAALVEPSSAEAPGDAIPASLGQHHATTSAEDISALPVTPQLKTSPHLRPVADDAAVIPYDFRQSPELPQVSEVRAGKMARRDSPNKRGAAELSFARRQSSKKRKNDHLREEEIRSMSAAGFVPRRFGVGLLRRDTKKVRDGLRSDLSRPTSEVTLPVQEDLEPTNASVFDSWIFRLNMFGIIVPRPTIRFSLPTPPPTFTTDAETHPEKQEKPQRTKNHMFSREDLKENRRIDVLADDLDAHEIRDIMEREKRRRAAKKQLDVAKLQRRLERRAERQRRRELLDNINPEEVEAGDDAVAVGLGIDRVRSSISDEGARDLQEPHHEAIEPDPVDRLSEDINRALKLTPSPETEPQRPVTPTNKTIEGSDRGHLSPPASPIQPSSTIGTQSVPSIVPISSHTSLQQEPAAYVGQSTSRSPQSTRGIFASFFRRGASKRKAASPQSKVVTPPDATFANVSRESMSRQSVPSHLQDRGSIGSRPTSGTPARTLSKFREDLPESPISRPDSRVQIPGSNSKSATSITGNEDELDPDPVQATTDPFVGPDMRTTSASGDRPGSALVAESLASIDSEGSWLSGRPSNKNSISRRSGQPGSLTATMQGEVDRGPPKSFSQEVAKLHDLGVSSRPSTRSSDKHIVTAMISGAPLASKARSGSPLRGARGKDSLVGLGDHAAYTRSNPVSRKSSGHIHVIDANEGETLHTEGVSRQPTIARRNLYARSSEGLVTDSHEVDDAQDKRLSGVRDSYMNQYVESGESYLTVTPRDTPSHSPAMDDGDFDYSGMATDTEGEITPTRGVDEEIEGEPLAVESGLRRATSVPMTRPNRLGHVRTVSAGSNKLLTLATKESTEEQDSGKE